MSVEAKAKFLEGKGVDAYAIAQASYPYIPNPNPNPNPKVCHAPHGGRTGASSA